jgi:hypothetical protein
MTIFEREEQRLWERLERAGANLLASGQSVESVEKWMNEEHQREYGYLLTMRRTFEFLDEIKRRREKTSELGEKGLKRPSGLPNNGNGSGGSRRGGRGRDSSRGGEL